MYRRLDLKVTNQPKKRVSFESIVKDRFYQFVKQERNPFMDFLYNEKLRRTLDMINFEAKKNSSARRIVLDLGCGHGYFSRVLSLQFTTIGLDINKRFKVQTRKFKKLFFILADISFLPFRSHSVDIVVCLSVLEHLQNLDDIVKKIKDVLKRDGIFIAGYPVETKFFRFILRLVNPMGFRFMNRSQTYWHNPNTGNWECYWESPDTHKQDYQTIRHVLSRHFKVLHKEKLPFDIFPDSITYYEIIKMRNTI